MNKKHIFLPVVCIILLSACSLFPEKKHVIEVVSPLSPFEESLQLDSQHIANFRLHGMTKTGEESVYLREKNTVRDAYNAGDRSINILRAYLYLSALEGDFDMKSKLETELCTVAPETCQKSLVPVTVSGVVRDSLGKNLSGVVIELL
jgi:hypothetical protein